MKNIKKDELQSVSRKRTHSWDILMDSGFSTKVSLIEQMDGELTFSFGDSWERVWSLSELLQLRLTIAEALKMMKNEE